MSSSGTPVADAAALTRVREPLRLGPLTLPHRIVMGSMHTGLEARDGGALDAFYRERAAGGAGLIVTGGLAISREARGGPDYPVFASGAVADRWRAAVDAVHGAGGLIAAQLFHAGRYAVTDGLTDADGRPQRSVAPSPVPWRGARGAIPHELTDAEVRATIDDFAAAAALAADVGFDAVEVMASEGYLLNQFCSPLTNQRDDEWGGDAARRRRFAVAVVSAARAALSADRALIVRVSAADLMPDSSTQAEVDELARDVVAAGAHALSLGVGWHESTVPTVQAVVPHGVWLDYAERLVRAVADNSVPVIASNRFTDLRDAEAALARGLVSAVSLARPFLADPTIVARSFAGDFASVNTCIGCDQACIDRSLVFQPVSCLVNPRAGRESEFPLPPRPIVLLPRPHDRRDIAVAGAGPAGLAAAVDLARRGHRVTLFEADTEPGGQFRLASAVPGKEDYALTVRAAMRELSALGADVRLGTPARASELSRFDGVIDATGVVPRILSIPGADLPQVLAYDRAIRDGVPAGRVVIIGGGGIGVDLAASLVESPRAVVRAELFASRLGLAGDAITLEGDGVPQRQRSTSAVTEVRPGSLVTVLRRSGKFGAGVGITSRWVALGRLRDAGVSMLAGLAYEGIDVDGVWVRLADGTRRLIPADAVVVCAGQERNLALATELAAASVASRMRVETVGGARDARSVDAVRATSEGIEAARRITA